MLLLHLKVSISDVPRKRLSILQSVQLAFVSPGPAEIQLPPAVETVRMACLVRVPPRQAYKDIVKSLQDWPWNCELGCSLAEPTKPCNLRRARSRSKSTTTSCSGTVTSRSIMWLSLASSCDAGLAQFKSKTRPLCLCETVHVLREVSNNLAQTGSIQAG